MKRSAALFVFLFGLVFLLPAVGIRAGCDPCGDWHGDI